ncbi:MAG: hypothetical protein ACFCVH_06790 [Alphaproteobacteria bacterium]
MRWLRRFLWLLAFLLLTVGTQIGGIAMLVSHLLARLAPRRWRATGWRRAATGFVAFALVYAVATVAVVPPLAALGGRAPLRCFPTDDAPYGALSVLYCASNRHYARQPLHDLVAALAADLSAAHPGSEVRYLDAGLPFFDWFPLIPHITHRDGLKLDLAFLYEDLDGSYVPGLAPWPVGYWAYDQPRPGERQPCADHVDPGFSLRWDMAWLQPLLPPYAVDIERTGFMARWLVAEGPAHGLRRMLLEPHLADRWGVAGGPLGFQGCRAGRHDDHIHISVQG